METTPFLRPTALQHLRGFLAESGAGLPPWSSSDEVMDELVALLHAHRGDDAFFARLVPFVQELREHAARGAAGLTAADADVLGRSTVESIVDELQAALRTSSRSASSKLVSSILGPQACRLLCLALLSSGLVACTQRPADAGSGGEPGTAPPTSARPAETAPAAAPPASTGSPDALVELFKNKSPQEAAKELERALDAGRPAPGRDLRNVPRPAYKGVEFA